MKAQAKKQMTVEEARAELNALLEEGRQGKKMSIEESIELLRKEHGIQIKYPF